MKKILLLAHVKRIFQCIPCHFRPINTGEISISHCCWEQRLWRWNIPLPLFSSHILHYYLILFSLSFMSMYACFLFFARLSLIRRFINVFPFSLTRSSLHHIVCFCTFSVSFSNSRQVNKFRVWNRKSGRISGGFLFTGLNIFKWNSKKSCNTIIFSA